MTISVYEPSVPLGQWNGGEVSSWVSCVRAENPGPMTLDGTNTWIISKPGSHCAVIIDPGPATARHWRDVEARLELLGIDAAAGQVAAILITHHHADHTEAIDLFYDRTNAPVYARTPEHCRAGGEVDFGEVVEGSPVNPLLPLDLAGLELVLVSAPGHTQDSIAIMVPEAKIIFTGDTILGRGTTVVAYPDGNLGQYFASVQRIRELTIEHHLTQILPGHGPTITGPLEAIDYYLEHRQARLQQVTDCLTELSADPATDPSLAQQVVEKVYADVPQHLWPPATLSVLAQLEYLASQQNR